MEIERKEEKVNMAISFNAYSRMNCIMYVHLLWMWGKKSKKAEMGNLINFPGLAMVLNPMNLVQCVFNTLSIEFVSFHIHEIISSLEITVSIGLKGMLRQNHDVSWEKLHAKLTVRAPNVITNFW